MVIEISQVQALSCLCSVLVYQICAWSWVGALVTG